ncbi:hypothetical protein THMIRHAS_11480 [Thiosulfatimonas sediminis]|uniref:Abortive phage infection protein C-terminal domain-containing protein n=1 Tax=Thiosulfatimonas sediminis TaxID=2675054 RepID=A0A6F8PUH6_9GAMM|nr:AIPR family protein [Thiosulfatimonas sediminis]BBP45775.1 hypothetical protein THMIRHAS_11480 [Thiosulfatimonas sediminis]
MSNNKILLEGCIKKFQEVNELELEESELFELFSLTQIHKDQSITFENIENSIVDGSKDGGIDSIMIFIDDELVESIDDLESFNFSNRTKTVFIISQCKKEKSFKETVVDKLITSIPVLLDLEQNESTLLKRFNPDLVSQALLLLQVWKDTAIGGGNISLDYMYVTNANEVEVNNVFIEKVSQLKALTIKLLSTSDVTFDNFSSKELLELYQKQKLNRLSLEFKDRPLMIDYGKSGIGYIGTVTLAKYKEFLTSENNNIRDDLFESNIRHFQGLVDVNKNIMSTINNPSDEDFWWLNNGITIIAEEPKEVGKTLSIENVQIVNGLQTSYSIYNNHSKDESDKRSVLVKVIINNDKNTTDHIIASTNSQNPVSPTLLRATEKIQRDLELYFLNSGYYYDRRKNYYKNLGKPSTKTFSIQYVAQSIQSIINVEPHSARATPTTLLKKDASYKSIFNSSRDFKAYLNCCLINRKVNEFWTKFKDAGIKAKTSNFKFHLSLLLTVIVLESKNVKFQDIVDFDFEKLNQAEFDDAIDRLSKLIEEYLNDNENTNLINIAKSKSFTNFLLDNFNGTNGIG